MPTELTMRKACKDLRNILFPLEIPARADVVQGLKALADDVEELGAVDEAVELKRLCRFIRLTANAVKAGETPTRKVSYVTVPTVGRFRGTALEFVL